MLVNEILVRVFFLLLLTGVFVGGLLLIAKYWFPKQGEEYLGGKPREHNNKLWMDD